MKSKNIVLIVCSIFLITSPIGQIIFGYAGGLLAYVTGEVTNTKSHQIAHQLMLTLSLISLIGFTFSTTTIQRIITSILTVFFICNFVLFYSLESKSIGIEYFYPDRFVIGSILSFIILKVIDTFKSRINNEKQANV